MYNRETKDGNVETCEIYTSTIIEVADSKSLKHR